MILCRISPVIGDVILVLAEECCGSVSDGLPHNGRLDDGMPPAQYEITPIKGLKTGRNKIT